MVYWKFSHWHEDNRINICKFKSEMVLNLPIDNLNLTEFCFFFLSYILIICLSCFAFVEPSANSCSSNVELDSIIFLCARLLLNETFPHTSTSNSAALCIMGMYSVLFCTGLCVYSVSNDVEFEINMRSTF